MVIVPAPIMDQQNDELRLYRVKEVMSMLGLSKTVIYEQLRAGRLCSVRQGRARLITASAIRDYITLLESEAQGWMER
jgi:excisionase family DNA binding protein